MIEENMNILLLGSGAREHNFANLLLQSKQCKQLFVAPGNAGTAMLKNCTNVDLDSKDDKHTFVIISEFIEANNVGMVLIGPEAPLVDGLVDYLHHNCNQQNLVIVGPKANGALLEGSKNFAKEIMHEHSIPTAKSTTFNALEQEEALQYLTKKAVAPYVLKADGLAAGKGVIVTSDLVEAQKELKAMFEGKFGEAGKTVVIEQYLKGIELSVIVLVDEDAYIILPTSKDYKRMSEGDTGKNTGGMGAIGPVPFADEAFMKKVEERIIQPMLKAIKSKGIDYWGFMYFGLMNVDGNPYVIEINCRMGDPEASVILPKIKTDFIGLLEECTVGTLEDMITNIVFDNRNCVTIVLAAEGYPDNYEKGKVITGLDNDFGEDVIIAHAGTKVVDGQIVTNGGRVLDITCFGETLGIARDKCLEVAKQIDFEGKNYRTDIGHEFIGETHNHPNHE